jgi:2-polyprenyl-6-methoxyphenol hydroxylase-like FAD-dependent oxidoreductase
VEATIVGGGIGGLCAAIALRQAGIEATVFERAPELHAVGAGITLWSNAIRALRTLGVADAVIAAGASVGHAAIKTASGAILSETDAERLARELGEPIVAIHRADLHAVLRKALPVDAVRLDHALTAIDGTTARFENGASVSADVVVGADGVSSVVRAQLFPERRLRYAGYTAWRGIVETTEESALGTTSESWGRGARFGIVRVDRTRVYWFATANTPAGVTTTPEERQALLAERFAPWHAPIPALIRATPADAILHNDIWDLPPSATWGRGRVTLLGDAIHATTPNLGQGACMAIESAVVLARHLRGAADVEAALRAYERERQPRTAWITEASWTLGRVGQLENAAARALRDLAVRLTPAAVTEKTLRRAATPIV